MMTLEQELSGTLVKLIEKVVAQQEVDLEYVAESITSDVADRVSEHFDYSDIASNAINEMDMDDLAKEVAGHIDMDDLCDTITEKLSANGVPQSRDFCGLLDHIAKLEERVDIMTSALCSISRAADLKTTARDPIDTAQTLSQVAAFERQCEDKAYTDTGRAWEIIELLREEVEALTL